MRRSALIGPWGVGAIVPFPNDEVLMIAGLDAWRYNESKEFVIHDDRLLRRLGISELRWPPDFREKNVDSVNCAIKIPTLRFPTWYYCPFCGQMKKTTYYENQPKCDAIQWKDGRRCSASTKRKRNMIPERFVVICPEGHIDDFPVAEWVHHGSGHSYNQNTCQIRRSTGGASSNLTGVFYQCSFGANRSMAGATSNGSLARMGYSCKATKPWLGCRDEGGCISEPETCRVVLRGATNVWFADVRSSIFIPTDDISTKRKIVGILNQWYETVSSSRTNGEFNKYFIHMIANKEGVDFDELHKAFLDREKNLRINEEIDENISEDMYRFQEYNVLCKSSGNDSMDFHSINYHIDKYDSIIHKYFDSISLVPKLRETRAFIGFSRLEPNQKSVSDRKKELRLGEKEDWLPAIEVYGEGIFLKFNGAALEDWAKRSDVCERVGILNRSYQNSRFRMNNAGDLRPEYILVHTLAHLIINQLSYDCGYGSSSIRERIYCEKTGNELGMYGVLIYTASGDSEGSMGGLVRQGQPGRLEDTVVSAIENASWCTSDPICIQSMGQGPESLNLAACHNCTLLPETCCENGNRLLDRGVVCGTLQSPHMGFFSDLKECT